MLSVDRSLARRLEAAQAWRGVEYVRALRSLRPELDVAVQPIAGAYAIFTGDAFPVNRVTGLGLGAPIRADDLASVEAFYRRRGAVPRVDLCPLADPSLLSALGERGYRIERFYSVLAQPLGDGTATPLPPARICVREVAPDEADLWLRTVARGFDPAPEPSRKTLDILAPNYHGATSTCFLAWLDGQPVGGGALVIHDGVAELCSASTPPAFRSQGVQTALLAARLRAASEAGCDLALAVTLPGTVSQRNAGRAGFCLAYTKAVVALP
jgi:GNAT superfamily N-acetyltransferase